MAGDRVRQGPFEVVVVSMVHAPLHPDVSQLDHGLNGRQRHLGRATRILSGAPAHSQWASQLQVREKWISPPRTFTAVTPSDTLTVSCVSSLGTQNTGGEDEHHPGQ